MATKKKIINTTSDCPNFIPQQKAETHDYLNDYDQLLPTQIRLVNVSSLFKGLGSLQWCKIKVEQQQVSRSPQGTETITTEHKINPCSLKSVVTKSLPPKKISIIIHFNTKNYCNSKCYIQFTKEFSMKSITQGNRFPGTVACKD